MHTISGAKSLAGQIYTGVQAGLMNLSWRIFLKRQWRWKRGSWVTLDADTDPRWFHQIALQQNKPNQVPFFGQLSSSLQFVVQRGNRGDEGKRRAGERVGRVDLNVDISMALIIGHSQANLAALLLKGSRGEKESICWHLRQMAKWCAKALVPYKILIFAIVCYRELWRPFADVNNGKSLCDVCNNRLGLVGCDVKEARVHWKTRQIF